MVQITNYTGIKNIYFNKILFEIIKIGNLYSNNKKILDYGCGEKQLQKILNKKILNYDLNPNLTEITNIEDHFFNIVILNHVLMYMKKDEICNLFEIIKKINPHCEFIIGIGKQNLISKIAKNISFNFDAHTGTISSYQDQLDIILQKQAIKNVKKNIFFMTDIYYTKLV